VLELIASQPSVGEPALNTRLRGVRRVLMHRVDHYLYCRVRESSEPMLQVVAVWPTSRGRTRCKPLSNSRVAAGERPFAGPA